MSWLRDKAGRWKGLSLRGRLVGSTAILSALGLIGAGAAGLLIEQQRIENRVEQSLGREIAEFTEFAATGVDPATRLPFASPEQLMAASIHQTVADEHEVHLGFTPTVTVALENSPHTLEKDTAFRKAVTQYSTPEYGEYQSPKQGHIVFAVKPIITESSVSHYVVAYFIDRELAELQDTIRTYSFAAAAAWIALVATSWMLSGRILKPIQDLHTMTTQITDQDPSHRIDIKGNDEVAALGTSFNSMLDRLEDGLHVQRRMLDDAGHELRTPLTIIRGHLELMDPHDPSDVQATTDLALDELDRMSVIVQDLLTLAKARRPDFLRLAPTDIADLVSETTIKARGLSSERVWHFEVDGAGTAVLDPQRIAQALLQLASNAVKATTDGDTITLGGQRTGDAVRLWVRDTGPGVPVALRQRIFDRYTSSPESNKAASTGLGLAIVLAIAQAHGGSAWVTSGDDGKGALFIMEFPAHEPAPDAAPDSERSTR